MHLNRAARHTRTRGGPCRNGPAVSTPVVDDERGGTIAIGFSDDEAAVRKLRAHGVQVDRRRRGVRFSPHVYNTMEEINAVCALLADIAWEET
jgi:kynureninase